MTSRPVRSGDDDGQVLVLVVGVAVLAIALAVTLAAVSGLLLERKRLVSVADNAAASAAADASTGDVYGAIDRVSVAPTALTVKDVRTAVVEHLERQRVADDGIEIVDVTADGTSVTVTLRRTVRPWLVGTFADVLGGDGVVVVGTGRARQPDPP